MYRLFDFFTKYELEDGIQNNLFNQRYSDPRLLWIFYEDPETLKQAPTVDKDFRNAIINRIYRQSHIIIFIYGSTNSGKSEIAQSIAKFYKKQFYRIHNTYPSLHLAFNDDDFKKAIPNLEIGDILIRDESSDVTGEGSRILQTRINNLVRVVRAHQNSFIFVNPDIIKAPLIDYYIETAGKNYEARRNRMILYTRYLDPNNNPVFQPIGRMYFNLHNDAEFRKKYKIMKDKNIQKLKESAGLVEVSIDEDLFTRDVYALYEYLERYDVYHKTDIKAMLIEYNKTVEKREERIEGSHVDDVITRVSLALSGKVPLKPTYGEEDSEEVPSEMLAEIIAEAEKDTDISIEDKVRLIDFTGFEWEEKIFDLIRKKDTSSRKLERDIMIYQLLQQGHSQSHLAEVHETTQENISIIKKRIEGKIFYYKGHLFESYVKKQLEKSKLFSKVVHHGGSGETDLLAYTKDNLHLFVYSIKNISIDPEKPYIPKKQLAPEIKFCNEFKNDYHTYLIPLIRDDVTGKIFQPFYDYKHPRDLTIFV